MRLIDKYLLKEDSFSDFKNNIYMFLTNSVSSLSRANTADQMMKILNNIENDVKTLKKFYKKRIQ